MTRSPASTRHAPLLRSASMALSALLAGLTLLVHAGVDAQAEREPSGILSAPLLLQHNCLVDGCESAGVGGALLLDLLHPLRAAPFLNIGGFVGIAVVGGEADTTRVAVPAGASMVAGLFPSTTRRFGFEVRVRAGGWFGAGAWGNAARADLGGGGFLSGGLHATLGLGAPDIRQRLRLTLGVDIIRLFGTRAVTLYAPGFALAWHSASRTSGADP